jgi:hypothetical protein
MAETLLIADISEMTSNTAKLTHRFNTRIRLDQRDFIKTEVKKSLKTEKPLSEGDVLRNALDFYITNYKPSK